MKRKNVLKSIRIILIFALCSFLFACTNGETYPDGGAEVNEDIPEAPSVFIYSDTCVITSIQKSEETITFQNLETGLRYTLGHDNLTFFSDRYGNSMVASQLSIGQICNISFYREEKKLKSLEIAPDYFAYTNVEGFKFYNSATRMEYLGDKYELDENIVVCSGRENINILEISDTDVLTIHGNGHVIYSITVDKGHGYLSLENDKYFIDGFIEIEKDIRKITEEMVITVPEGNYSVLISKDGTSAIKEVTVGRNQEAKIDLGDIEIKKNYGNVNFTINAPDAIVYIDSEKVNDISKPVRIEYGIHEMIIRADGYESVSKFISVGAPDADISITLDKLADSDTDEKDDASEDKVSNDTDPSDTEESSGQTEDNATENENKTRVYIDAPASAEVYLDGNYIGVVPTSFPKKIGTIVITLKKDGCQPRSYTINLEDLTTDSRYSFSELLTVE